MTTRGDLKDDIMKAIVDALPGRMQGVMDQRFADAADAILDIMFDAILSRRYENMIDLVGVEHANVMISEHARHLWVCTEKGTVLRIKAKTVTLEDLRLRALCDGCGQNRMDVTAVPDGRAQMCPECMGRVQSHG